MQDEDAWIRAAARGDRKAFDELVRIKRERVVRIARQITGNLEDALDVAQVVFMRVWSGLGGFDMDRRFDTWLHRVTVNAAIDHCRSRRARPEAPFPTIEPAAPQSSDPEARVDLARLRNAFRTLSLALPPQQRAAFVLRDMEGLSTTDVARALGLAESTVRNHLMQARRSLRRGLVGRFPDLARSGSDPETPVEEDS